MDFRRAAIGDLGILGGLEERRRQKTEDRRRKTEESK